MNNPLHILQTLNRHLTAPAEITLFGRAALTLGYEASPAAFAMTHDVDAILPLSWVTAEDQNLDFWQAQQRTNTELEPAGLYLTHLFREVEVILTPEWLTRRVGIPLELARLTVFRPATLDLILTKMARGDDNDLADIEFMLIREPQTPDQLRAAFARARVPEVPEIHALFHSAQPKVLALAAAQGHTHVHQVLPAPSVPPKPSAG